MSAGYVLLVDDDEDLRTLMAEELARGYPVVEAASAEEALARLATHGAPAAVVSDLNLGRGLRGDDLLAAVAALHPSATRLLVSGTPLREVAGDPHAFLGKPWMRGQLLALVNETVARAGAEALAPAPDGRTGTSSRARLRRR